MSIRTRMMPTINTHMMELKRLASRTRIHTSMNVCGTVIRMSLTCIMHIGTDARDWFSEQLHARPANPITPGRLGPLPAQRNQLGKHRLLPYDQEGIYLLRHFTGLLEQVSFIDCEQFMRAH